MQTKDLRMTINIVVYSDYNYMLVLIYVVSFDDDSTSNPPSSNNVRLPAAAALLRRLSERHWEGGGSLPRVLVVVKHRFGGGSFGRGLEDLKLAQADGC